MKVRQQPEERLFGIDWSQADEIGVASVGWRDATGARLKRGVEINLCNDASESGMRITVSRVRARQIAIALAQASGMSFGQVGPLRPLPLRLSRLLEQATKDISQHEENAA